MMTSSNRNIFRVTGHLCGEFTGPTQRPVTWIFNVFFDLRVNKRLSKQWWGWWFETLSRPLWRHRNVNIHDHGHTQTLQLQPFKNMSPNTYKKSLTCIIYVKLRMIIWWGYASILYVICAISIAAAAISLMNLVYIFQSWSKQEHDCPRPVPYSQQWRHNGREGVSNHQSHNCLLNRLFRHRSKKPSKLRVTGLCAGNSPGTGEFPAQMASNAENVSIWWRHNDNRKLHHWSPVAHHLRTISLNELKISNS